MPENLDHRPFQITRLNKGRVAIELLTGLLFLDVFYVVGQWFRHSSLRHVWVSFLFGLAVVVALLLLAQTFAEKLAGSKLRSILVRLHWPIVFIGDRLRLVNFFPLSLVTILWLRLVHRQYWHDHEYRSAFELSDPPLAALLTASAKRDHSEAVELAKQAESSPHSLLEYMVARDLRGILATAQHAAT